MLELVPDSRFDSTRTSNNIDDSTAVPLLAPAYCPQMKKRLDFHLKKESKYLKVYSIFQYSKYTRWVLNFQIIISKDN